MLSYCATPPRSSAPWARRLRLHRGGGRPGCVRALQRDHWWRLPQPGGRAAGRVQHHAGPEGTPGGKRQGHRLTHRQGRRRRHGRSPFREERPAARSRGPLILMSLRLLASPAAERSQPRCQRSPHRARARSGQAAAARPFQAWLENAITLRDGLSMSRCTPSRLRDCWSSVPMAGPGTHRQPRRDRRPAPAGPAQAANRRIPPCCAASPPSWPPATAPSISGAASTSCYPG